VLQTLHADNQLHYRNIQSTLGDNAQSGTTNPQNTNGGASTTTTTTATTTTTDNFVLLAGHHFILVVENSVVVDYLFGGKNQSDTAVVKQPGGTGDGQTTGQGDSSSSNTKSSADTPSATAVDSGSTFGPNKKTFGPLTIQNVSASA